MGLLERNDNWLSDKPYQNGMEYFMKIVMKSLLEKKLI